MKKDNLTIIQKDIDEALATITAMEKFLLDKSLPREVIKEKFVYLSGKVQQLENILKEEGILD